MHRPWGQGQGVKPTPFPYFYVTANLLHLQDVHWPVDLLGAPLSRGGAPAAKGTSAAR